MAEPVPADAAADVVVGDFAEIMRRHQSMVFSIALHFLADPPAAEELAQDVFMQLHAKLSTLKSPEHMVFWLRKVTSHRCIDRMRRHRMP
jgi:RNA polymerase sigma-70 factor (ECF subfamily)